MVPTTTRKHHLQAKNVSRWAMGMLAYEMRQKPEGQECMIKGRGGAGGLL